LADRYELRSVLGRGGMADVWQGFDRRLERVVAVKVLHPAGPADPLLPTRFDREARIVALRKEFQAEEEEIERYAATARDRALKRGV